MKIFYAILLTIAILAYVIGCRYVRNHKDIKPPEPGIYRMVMVFQDTVLKIGVITYEQYDQEPYLCNGQVILCYPDIGEVVVANDVYSFKIIKQ